MKFNLFEHYKNISKYLTSQYHLSSSYGHRGSKGQLREDFLTKTLQEIAHDHIKIVKGEICDSNGRRSPEFDIIISYLSNTIKLFSSEMNHVIPIETILSVIEVKSILDKKGILKFNEDLKFLNSFDRFYLPTQIYEQICRLKGTNESAIFNKSICPTERVFGISPIVGGMIAFESPQIETFKSWINSFEPESNFTYIFVVGHFLAVKDKIKNNWITFERGDATFGLFASIFTELLTETNGREHHIQADSKRYVNLMTK